MIRLFQPGNYTITIKSTGAPIIALVRNSDGDAVTHVVSGARSGNPNGVNAILVKEKGGQLKVHSLALADLGMVLIYDPGLAREAVQEARASKTVPVMWTKVGTSSRDSCESQAGNPDRRHGSVRGARNWHNDSDARADRQRGHED